MPVATPASASSSPTNYVGRFAPSPTGPLHFGSLISALASFLDARAHCGRWLLRIEDIDPLREQPGATDAILASLRAHGLHWDDAVLYQSQRLALYRDAAHELVAHHAAFYCSCSRTQLAQRACPCHETYAAPTEPAAIRLKVPAEERCFADRVQGDYCEQVNVVAGDFVIYRKEQLPAYQLAVVIDDAAQDITHVVRGCDLLDNTVRQLVLQEQLQLPTPRYAHVPVIANSQGQKLSKQTYARALDDHSATDNLRAALDFLGQAQPPDAIDALADLLDFAIAHWSLEAVPRARQISGDSLPTRCRPFAA